MGKYRLLYSGGNMTPIIEAKRLRDAYRDEVNRFKELDPREQVLAGGFITSTYFKVLPSGKLQRDICSEQIVKKRLAEHRRYAKGLQKGRVEQEYIESAPTPIVVHREGSRWGDVVTTVKGLIVAFFGRRTD